MQNLSNQTKFSLSRLNSALHSSSKPSPYVWVEDSVALKNPSFDEPMFRKCKIARMVDQNTPLSIGELQQILEQVIRDSAQLVLEISYATQEKWLSCDARFNENLDQALAEARAAAELKLARTSATIARSTSKEQMPYPALDAIAALAKRGRLDFPAQTKFMNKSSH